jgi:hypothetical protein
VGATVLSLGMTFTVGQLVAPLHRVMRVIAMVTLNAVVIPAAAGASPKYRQWAARTCRAWSRPPSAQAAQRR